MKDIMIVGVILLYIGLSSCTQNEQKVTELKNVAEQNIDNGAKNDVDEQMVDDVVGGLLEDSK